MSQVYQKLTVIWLHNLLLTEATAFKLLSNYSEKLLNKTNKFELLMWTP